ncbi:winged helix-turn-helix domain-containing protein, partial [Clostridium paraputrificum]
LEIDFDKFILNKNGERVDITPTEFKLLKVFVNSKGKVLTRNNLLEELWDKDQNFIDEHALTVNINRLRSKIESKDDGVKYIKTIYGIGYMWIGEDA